MASRLRTLCHIVRQGLHDCFNLYVPRYCPVCNHPLNTTEQYLCGGCLVTLPYSRERDFYDNYAARLFMGKIPIERVHGHLLYGEEKLSHPIINKLKYHHRPDLAVAMGRMMALAVQPQGFFDGVDCIVPVPLHWIRKLKRGYNQSEKLAEGVAEVTGLPIFRHHVVRMRNNPTQTHKTKQERIANTQNLFQARKTFTAHHILLIDDVMTTGSTLTSCAHAILQSSPDIRISILTLCKVK